MKVLILGAGYGTRLERDIRNDKSGKFSALVGLPKPLIPIAGKELLTYWHDLLLQTNSTGNKFSPSDIYIVANQHNYSQYKEWASRHKIPAANIINDGSVKNEERLGAIKDIVLTLDVAKIDEDLMVIGGDTLFFDDFDLGHVIQTFNSRNDNLVLWYDCPDADVPRTGILVTNEKSIVTGFVEKPQPHETPSRKACPCFYMYKKAALPVIRTYVAQATTLQQVDAPGSLIEYLHERSPVYAYAVSGRFDIGGLDTYIEADNFFRQRAEALHNKEKNQKLWCALGVGIALPLIIGGVYYLKYGKSRR